MALFGLGKRRKPNLTPAMSYRSANESPMWNSLSTLANKRIAGEGLGFGEGFVDKTANPAIAKVEANYRESTLPRINQELSKRGMARSTNAIDQITRAEQSKNRDVEDIYSQYFLLNERQKKSDQTEGINLGRGLQADYLNQENLKAGASERLANATAAQQNQWNTEDRADRDKTISAILGGITGGSTGGLNGVFSGGSAGFSSNAGFADILGKTGLSADELTRLREILR